ncbi:MAG: hypothetical protein PHH16_00465 [Candidatus Gracilibacteria bacterium]|nr:hypothetical protein [Candidatus Gracilibacteria bacterium]
MRECFGVFADEHGYGRFWGHRVFRNGFDILSDAIIRISRRIGFSRFDLQPPKHYTFSWNELLQFRHSPFKNRDVGTMSFREDRQVLLSDNVSRSHRYGL